MKRSITLHTAKLPRWEPEIIIEKEAHTHDFNPHNPSFQTANDEPSAKDALPRKAQTVQVDQRVCVRVHSKGRRLADIDGYVIKPIFDAFTKAGIWPDDSGRYVKEVSFSQEVSEVEETVIDIVWDSPVP